MNISQDEAARALSDIADAQDRSRVFRGYEIAGPILVLWGVIWMICYTAMGALRPELWGWIWLPADVVGIIATILMTTRHKNTSGTKTGAWRIFGFFALIILFCSAVFSLFQTRDVNVYLAFPGLLTGAIYGAIGIWRLPRYLWVGLAVFTATLIGFFAFPSWLAYWMAVAGGGGLIIGGLLIRRS